MPEVGRLYLVIRRAPKEIKINPQFARNPSFARLAYENSQQLEGAKIVPVERHLSPEFDDMIQDSFTVKHNNQYTDVYVIDVTKGFGPNLILPPMEKETFKEITKNGENLKPEARKAFDYITTPPASPSFMDIAIPIAGSVIGGLAGGGIGTGIGGSLASLIARGAGTALPRLAPTLGGLGAIFGSYEGEKIGLKATGQPTDNSFLPHLLSGVPFLPGVVAGKAGPELVNAARYGKLQREAESLAEKAEKLRRDAKQYGIMAEGFRRAALTPDSSPAMLARRAEEFAQHAKSEAASMTRKATGLRGTMETIPVNPDLEATVIRESTPFLPKRAGLKGLAGVTASLVPSAVAGVTSMPSTYSEPPTTFSRAVKEPKQYQGILPVAEAAAEGKSLIPVAPLEVQQAYTEKLKKLYGTLTGKGGNDAQGQ
jgi:hypothetical protein